MRLQWNTCRLHFPFSIDPPTQRWSFFREIMLKGKFLKKLPFVLCGDPPKTTTTGFRGVHGGGKARNGVPCLEEWASHKSEPYRLTRPYRLTQLVSSYLDLGFWNTAQ